MTHTKKPSPDTRKVSALADGRDKYEQKRKGGNEKRFLCDIVKVKNVRFYF